MEWVTYAKILALFNVPNVFLGWMHNRMRMITAMFLTKDLMLDWHLGEQVRYIFRRV